MSAIAKLRPAVDAFFDKVKVNDDDPKVRENRLKLLNEIPQRDARGRGFLQDRRMIFTQTGEERVGVYHRRPRHRADVNLEPSSFAPLIPSVG